MTGSVLRAMPAPTSDSDPREPRPRLRPLAALTAVVTGELTYDEAMEATSPFRRIGEYLQGVPDTVPWLAEPFAYFGGVTLLAGIWKGGKSTLVMQLLRTRETGGEWLGQPVGFGPCILVTEEGGIPVKRKAAGMTDLYILDRHEASLAELTWTQVQSQIVALCKRLGDPAVVVIDTLAVWGDIEDENDGAKVTKAIREISELAQATGAAVILVDHVRKEGGSHGRGIRGSGAKAATADIFAVHDYAATGVDTDRSLTLEGRVIDPTSLTLAYDKVAQSYGLVDKGEAKLAEVETYLEDVPADGDGTPLSMLASLWGCSHKTAKGRAEWLLDVGRMRRVMGKVGRADGWLYWSVLPTSST